jgi:F-type H+-transporting ATPase subunit epsilon
MTFHVTSLHGNRYQDEFDMAIIKSVSGEYAILDNHLPIMDHIPLGIVELRLQGVSQYVYVIDATIAFQNHILEVTCSDAQIGKSVEQAKKVLEDNKHARMQLAKAENIDFSKLEKDLYEFIKQAKSGSVS